MGQRIESHTGTVHEGGTLAWREERLRAAGFDRAAAAELAVSAIDIHAVLDLVDRGCPPHLAARICAPLDEQPAR